MTCCKCNRTGRCCGCACIKACRQCTSCLPIKQGKCQNAVSRPAVPATAAPATATAPAARISMAAPTLCTGMPPNPALPQPPSPQPHPAINPGPGDSFPAGIVPPPHGSSRSSAGRMCFIWGEVDGATFDSKLAPVYDVVIHWKPNLFIPPHGTIGNRFVHELAKLFQAFADGSPLGSIAMKAATVQQQLLLQKPSRSSKSKDHIRHLQRRLDLWIKGDLDTLLHEGQSIQSRLKFKSDARNIESTARSFGKLMKEGKVQAARNLLTRPNTGGILGLNDMVMHGDDQMTVRDILTKKHPPSATPPVDALLPANASPPHEIIFDNLDANLIHRAALRTKGAAGLSGLDAFAWRRLCTSYKSASVNLCKAMAAAGRSICTSSVDPSSMSAFVACRLIPLDKCPGVRPIGIGEVPRRIISKAILWILSSDIESAAGPLQTCAGQMGGCEAAIHAMRRIYQSPMTEGVLLVDAENAFNRLNRAAAIHNIKSLCPSLSTVLSNTYKEPVPLGEK